jgi:prepilin signal peptidase PulO-like enzyme (type II secretory pathway)
MNDVAWYTFPMHKAIKYGLLGFFFGTVGLYLLAMVSLMTPILEFLVSPLFFPGRWLGGQIGGADGSTGEVILLTLFNGILYALLFVLIRIIAKQTTGA